MNGCFVKSNLRLRQTYLIEEKLYFFIIIKIKCLTIQRSYPSYHTHKIMVKFLILTWLQYCFKSVIWGIQASVSNTFRRHLRSFVGIIFNTHIKSQASYVTKNGVPFVFFLLEETFSLSLLGSMGVRSRMQQLKYVIYTLINSHY